MAASNTSFWESFYNRFNRLYFVPSSYLGTWEDAIGRKVTLQRDFIFGPLKLSIRDAKNRPFIIEDLSGEKTPTTDLKTVFQYSSRHQCTHIYVEAGQSGIGPTYELYFFRKSKGELKQARHLLNPNKVILKPSVGLGLYDDWEDDLGVPWAWPLEDFRKRK